MHAPRALFVLPMLAVALMGCAGTDSLSGSDDDVAHDDDALSGLGGAISRSEVISRAQNWVNWHVMYSQDQSSPYKDGDGHSYRRDCSGYVSMAWHLPKKSDGWDYNTGDFWNSSKKSFLGSYNDLQAGDALDSVSYGHIVLFDKWANSSHSEMWIYQESDYGIPAEHVQQGISWYQNNGFRGIRYDNIEGSGGGSSGGGGGDSCAVQSDKKLHCDNKAGAALLASPHNDAATVNHLRTSPSWFKCWGTGDLHAGGNHTWYYTEGDDNSKYGWAPAVDLDTTSSFDANPSAHGLAKCDSSSSPPPPAEDPNCEVHSDKKLHCLNSSGAPLHSSPTNGSAVVNHLRTTDSWFTCWKTGDLHAGGNHTWYYTEGDDNSHWGYVPAVDLHTSSAFDSNPSAHGLAKCN